MYMIHYPERYTPSRSEYNKIPNLDHRRDIRPTPTALRERAPHIYAVQGRTKFAARRFSRTSR